MTYKRAFTLAEMAIVMVVLSVLALACVGFVKNKKIKKPRKMAEFHGLIECYYDDNGVLHSWSIDNRNNKNGKDKVVNGACEVKIPEAHFYNIIVVGAGGDGGKLNTVPTATSVFKDSGEKQISTGETFGADISAAPEWVRENWVRYSPSITYILNGPRGLAGARWSKTFYESWPECSGCNFNNDCPSSCRKSVSCPGGPGGKGLVAKISKKIGIDDQVITNGETTLSVGSDSIELGMSGNGWPATGSDEDMHCTNGNIGTPATTIQARGNFMVSFSEPNTSTNYGNGTLSINPSSVNYKTRYKEYSVSAGTSGTSGDVKNKIYEKLPSKTLKLIPALTNAASSEVHYLHETDTGSVYKFLLAADGGGNGDDDFENKYLADESMIFPGLQPDYPDKFDVKYIDITDMAYSHNFKSQIQQLGYKPGQSGYGGYPILLRSGQTPDIKGVLNNYTINTSLSITESANNGNPEDDKCLGDRSIDIASSNFQYCKSTIGKPGAILIVW